MTIKIKAETLKELILNYDGRQFEDLQQFSKLFSPYKITTTVRYCRGYKNLEVATAKTLSEAKKIVEKLKAKGPIKNREMDSSGIYDIYEFDIEIMNYRYRVEEITNDK